MYCRNLFLFTLLQLYVFRKVIKIRALPPGTAIIITIPKHMIVHSPLTSSCLIGFVIYWKWLAWVASFLLSLPTMSACFMVFWRVNAIFNVDIYNQILITLAKPVWLGILLVQIGPYFPRCRVHPTWVCFGSPSVFSVIWPWNKTFLRVIYQFWLRLFEFAHHNFLTKLKIDF